MAKSIAAAAPPNGVSASGGIRPRTRITAADLVPKLIPVLEIEDEDGQVQVHMGQLWGDRIRGTLESDILATWNEHADELGFVRDSRLARQRMEDVTLLFVPTLARETVAMLNTDELRAILEDVKFLVPLPVRSEAEPGAEDPVPPQEATTATT